MRYIYVYVSPTKATLEKLRHRNPRLDYVVLLHDRLSTVRKINVSQRCSVAIYLSVLRGTCVGSLCAKKKKTSS